MLQRRARLKDVAGRMGRSAAAVGLPRVLPAYMISPRRAEDWFQAYDEQRRKRVVVNA